MLLLLWVDAWIRTRTRIPIPIPIEIGIGSVGVLRDVAFVAVGDCADDFFVGLRFRLVLSSSFRCVAVTMVVFVCGVGVGVGVGRASLLCSLVILISRLVVQHC